MLLTFVVVVVHLSVDVDYKSEASNQWDQRIGVLTWDKKEEDKKEVSDID